MNIPMSDIQDKILEIAVYLDSFCKEHEIEYYLMGGSALGAIRHEGFIPWDDDLDVFMTYKNYLKFISACEKNLDENRFYLQKENTTEWPLLFSKLRMNGTTFVEEDTKFRDMHKGFYVDIMCLNNTTKNKLFRYIQYISARLIVAKTLAVRGYTTNSGFKKIAMTMTNLFIKGKVFNSLLWLVRSLNNKETEYVGHFFGRAKFKNTSFQSSYIGETRYVNFSRIKLPVIENVEEYLKVRYGERYMDMPDQETKDLYPVHAYFVDINNDYTKYE